MIKEEYNPKHSPNLEIKKVGNVYEISVEVGKEVKHPNESSHNIKWVDIYFQLEDGEVIQLARVDFTAHGENEIITEPKVKIYAKLKKGKVICLAYCNLHGIWKTEKEIE